MVYFSNMICWFSLPEIYPVSRFFPDFFRIYSNLRIFMILFMFSENRWYTFQTWYVLMEIHTVYGFSPDFSWIFQELFKFSDFYDSFHIFSENWWYIFQTWYVLLEIHPVSEFFTGFILILIFLCFISYIFRELIIYFLNMICLTGNSSGFWIFLPIFSNSQIFITLFI